MINMNTFKVEDWAYHEFRLIQIKEIREGNTLL